MTWRLGLGLGLGIACGKLMRKKKGRSLPDGPEKVVKLMESIPSTLDVLSLRVSTKWSYILFAALMLFLYFSSLNFKIKELIMCKKNEL